MPGTVVQLRVAARATRSSAGETLVVLESMKMEISIAAPRDGSVAEVLVAAGDRSTAAQRPDRQLADAEEEAA